MSVPVTNETRLLLGIDHVGVAVDDLVKACARLAFLGLPETARIERPDLRVVFSGCGDASIELIEILDPEARQARLGDARAVVEHIALVVDELDESAAAL